MLESGASLAVMVCGLGAAVCFGAGDFSGGVAAKRDPVLRVVVLSHVLSLILFVLCALAFAEAAPTVNSLAFGVAAGLGVVVGQLAFYRGLAIGPMSGVAAMSAILCAGVPVLAGILFAGSRISLINGAGLGLAASGIAMLARDGGARQATRNGGGLGYAMLAGLGFGISLALFARIESGSLFWPLAGARFVSSGILLTIAGSRGVGLRPARPGAIAVASILDTAGNLLYVIAAQTGLYVAAAALPNLYPAVTVILAFAVLHEFPSRAQWLGLGAALAASWLIALPF